MRASTIAVPVNSDAVSDLHALVVEPESVRAASSILLFLHGKGEAGSSLGSLPLVCIHQTAPFQALLGHLPETLVVAPQAPPIPNIDDWNWREYVKPLAEFLGDRYAKKRVVATGFSRGGLGVLQLVSAYPDLVQAWAAVDPQPARDQKETNAILPILLCLTKDGFDTVCFVIGTTRGKISALCFWPVFLIRTVTPPNCRTPKWQCRRIVAPS